MISVKVTKRSSRRNKGTSSITIRATMVGILPLIKGQKAISKIVLKVNRVDDAKRFTSSLSSNHCLIFFSFFMFYRKIIFSSKWYLYRQNDTFELKQSCDFIWSYWLSTRSINQWYSIVIMIFISIVFLFLLFLIIINVIFFFLDPLSFREVRK